MNASSFANQRSRLVDEELRRSGVRDERVLEALKKVPREKFLSDAVRDRAYENRPQPIDCSQTISQPLIVAVMTEALQLSAESRVLEIGTGSGYSAAILAEIAREVFTVERHATLAKNAATVLSSLGYQNIHIRHGDGTLGWPEEAPFDGIVVTAAGPHAPDSLRNQLAIGGRLVIPVGQDSQHQTLVCQTRTGPDTFREEELGAVRFVPLIGKEGWQEDQ